MWLSARLFYWNGYYTEDAPGYVTDAIWMALGNYHARDHVNGLNIGTYLPVALPIRLFGKIEMALSIWPMLSSLLGLLSIAGLCRLLFGPLSGLLAALLYATHPGDIFFSTVVMPDAIQAGWLSFSMFLVVAAFVRSGERTRLFLVGGGAALGVCHLVRANDVALLPIGLCGVACCSLLWRQARYRVTALHAGAFLFGWALVIVGEGLVYQWAVGDFLHRLHVVSRHYGSPASIARMGLNIDPHTIPYSLVPVFLWWRDGTWGRLNQEQSYHALLFCWALLSLLLGTVGLVVRARLERRTLAGLAFAAGWLLWPILYHQFGSQSLTDFVPMHRLSRHLVVYAPGAMVATVAGICSVSTMAWPSSLVSLRSAAFAGVAAALTVHLAFNHQGIGLAYDSYHRIKDTYGRIRSQLPPEVTTLSGDPGDLCFFDFWMNPLGSERVRMMAFAAYSTCEDIRAGVVLTQSNPGWEGMAAPVIQETVARLPCLVRPPAGWRLLYDGFPEKVYEVMGRERDARQ